MSEELPIPRQGDRSDGLAVIEWGADDDPAPRRRFGWSLAGLTQDPGCPCCSPVWARWPGSPRWSVSGW